MFCGSRKAKCLPESRGLALRVFRDVGQWLSVNWATCSVIVAFVVSTCNFPRLFLFCLARGIVRSDMTARTHWLTSSSKGADGRTVHVAKMVPREDADATKAGGDTAPRATENGTDSLNTAKTEATGPLSISLSCYPGDVVGAVCCFLPPAAMLRSRTLSRLCLAAGCIVLSWQCSLAPMSARCSMRYIGVLDRSRCYNGRWYATRFVHLPRWIGNHQTPRAGVADTYKNN